MKTLRFYAGLTLALLAGILTAAQPTQPGAPLSGNSSVCTPPLSETCPDGSTVVTSFSNAVLRSGSPTSLPALYSFYNVATVSGQHINATITIDQQQNCDMTGTFFSIDDDAATDQAGNSILSFFAPRITPASNLTTTDIRGYVQFTIRFYLENSTAGQQYPGDFSTPPPFGGLSGLNYIHYDIDGSTVGTGGWFRETGVVLDVSGSTVTGNASTELAAYSYTHVNNWKGFAGSVFERNGVSRCAEVAAAINYPSPQTSITFRMGYDYNYNGTSFNSRPTREYGSRFGCFNFPQQSTLPVKLTAFSGVMKKDGNALLNWEADHETGFSLYELERSTNGTDFSNACIRQGEGGPGTTREYRFTDNLAAFTEQVFYYRLKMVDLDGRFTYSKVIMLRRGAGQSDGLSISPNPAGSGPVTLRFSAGTETVASVRLIDMSGRIVLQQENRIFAGTNSISLIGTDKLLPGMYMVRLVCSEDILISRMSVIR